MLQMVLYFVAVICKVVGGLLPYVEVRTFFLKAVLVSTCLIKQWKKTHLLPAVEVGSLEGRLWDGGLPLEVKQLGHDDTAAV